MINVIRDKKVMTKSTVINNLINNHKDSFLDKFTGLSITYEKYGNIRFIDIEYLCSLDVEKIAAAIPKQWRIAENKRFIYISLTPVKTITPRENTSKNNNSVDRKVAISQMFKRISKETCDMTYTEMFEKTISEVNTKKNTTDTQRDVYVPKMYISCD